MSAIKIGSLTAIAFTGCLPPAASQPGAADYFAQASRVLSRYPDFTGEQFCWEAAWSIDHFVKGYLAYGDREWLDHGVRFYDALVAKMTTGPDGFRGWIGPYIYDKKVWCDVHVGDAILVNGMLRFAELVLHDKKLERRYGRRARAYVTLARKHVLTKWDARGTWRTDGPYGCYVSWNRYRTPGKDGKWENRPEIGKSNLSLPFNKQNSLAITALRVYRCTGETRYRKQAERIFTLMKSRFQFFDRHYVWNYWEPLGPWDIDLERKKARHWINVHPYRNYQAGEVRQIREAYHSGVVFTRRDLERILHTNLQVMWDGNRKDPNFVNSNVGIPGLRPPRPSKQYPTWAGTLWTGLADFSRTVRELQKTMARPPKRTRDRIDAEYFARVTCREPPGFRRRHVSSATDLPEVHLPECKGLHVVAALPSSLDKDATMILYSSSHAPGPLEVSVWSRDGKRRRCVLFRRDRHQWHRILEWDGRDPTSGKWVTGRLLVRWRFAGEYRQLPVVVRR